MLRFTFRLAAHELKLEVKDGDFCVPPVVMSHCLRFLCYHHLYNIVNRQQSLRDIMVLSILPHITASD
jgi:hypothetical protein